MAFVAYFWLRNRDLKEENSKLTKCIDKLQRDNDKLREKKNKKDKENIELFAENKSLNEKNDQLQESVKAHVRMRDNAQSERNFYLSLILQYGGIPNEPKKRIRKD